MCATDETNFATAIPNNVSLGALKDISGSNSTCLFTFVYAWNSKVRSRNWLELPSRRGARNETSVGAIILMKLRWPDGADGLGGEEAPR